MCNCKHSTAIGEVHNSTGIGGHQCDINPSISVGEGWESGYEDTIPDEMYTTARSNLGLSGMQTPKGRGIRAMTPDAPIREKIMRRPDLAYGVAIVQRRLDFDDATFAELDSGACPMRAPEESRKSRRQGSSRQYPPRMTKMTPSGKCLRM